MNPCKLTRKETAIIQAMIDQAKASGWIKYESETLQITITKIPKLKRRRRKK